MADIVYIEQGYYIGDNYFTRTADAAAALNTTTTVSCTITNVKTLTCDFQTLFTPTLSATILKNHTAVLDCTVTLLATISKTVANQSTLNNIVTLSLQGDRGRTLDSTLSASFTQSTQIQKILNASSTQNTQFTITADATILGAAIEAAATLNTEFAVSATVSRSRTVSVTFTVESTQTTDAQRFRGISQTLYFQATIFTQIGLLQNATCDFATLFSPTVTCVALRNHTAVLDAVSSLSCAITKTTAFTVTLNTEFGLNVNIVRLRAVSVTVNSAFTQSVGVGKTVDSVSTFNTAFSITNKNPAVSPNFFVGTLQTTSCNFQSFFTFYPNRWTGTQRPMPALVPQGQPGRRIFSSSIKKFGSHALGGDNSKLILNIGGSGYDINDVPGDDINNNLILGSFFKNFTITEDVYLDFYYQFNGSDSTDRKIAGYNNGPAIIINNRRFKVYNNFFNGAPGFTLQPTEQFAINTWHHVAVIYTNNLGRLSLYVNGTRIATTTSASFPWSQGAGLENTFVIRANEATYLSYFDEVRLFRGYTRGFTAADTTITEESTAYQTPETYLNNVIGVYHLDDNYQDDISLLIAASATLTAQCTQSVTAGKSVSASATLNTQFTVSAQVGEIEPADITMNTVSSLVTVATRIKTLASSLNSAVSLSVNISKITGNTATLNSAVTLSNIITRIETFQTQFTVIATELAAIAKIGQGLITMDVVAQITVTARRTAAAESNLNTQFGFTITAERIRFADSSFSVISSLNAVNSRIRAQNSTLDAEFAVTASNSRIRSTNATFNTIFALTAEPLPIKQLLADLNSNFGISSVLSITKTIAQQFNCVSTFTVSGIKAVESVSALLTEFALSTQNSRTRSFITQFNSIATELAAIAKIGQGLISMANVTTFNSTPVKTVSVTNNQTRRVAKNITLSGQTQVSAAQSKFGGAAILMDGVDDAIKITPTTDFQFGLSAFTVEAWVRPTGNTTFAIWDARQSNFGTTELLISGSYQPSTDNFGISLIYNGTTIISAINTPKFQKNTWTHIACQKESGQLPRIYVNGSVYPAATQSDTGSGIGTLGLISIGDFAPGIINDSLTGYIDEIRVSTGIRYATTGFTPIEAPFESDANTLLLIHGDVTIADDVGPNTTSNPTVAQIAITYTNIKQTSIALSATVNITANGVSNKDVVMSAQCVASQSTQAVKTARISSNMSTQGGFVMAVRAIRNGEILMLTQASITAAVRRTRLTGANLTNSFTLNILAGVLAVASSVQNCTVSITVTAGVLRLDDIILYVKTEARSYSINNEQRSYALRQENRLYTIEE